MTKYISSTDTAKLVRKALKENFPGIKFSVKTRHSSIYVEWTNGPSLPAVRKVAGFFAGATFDGMIDLKEYVTVELNGEKVQFGSNYVFCSRNLTRAFIEAIIPQFRKEWGFTEPISVGGDDDSAYIMRMHDYGMEQYLQELLSNTDEKDMHRAYAAEKEQQARQRAAWEAEHKAEQEREAREQAEAEQKRREEEAKAERERLAREQAEFEKWCSQYFTSPIWDLLDMTEKKELYRRWKVEEEAKQKEAQKQGSKQKRKHVANVNRQNVTARMNRP